MLILQADGHELEIVAYKGEVRWGRDVTGDSRLLSIHPSNHINFVVGQILEPFTYGRQPAPLQSPVISGKMLIHQAEKAWLGAVCQLISADTFYEADEVFNWHEAWTDNPMPGYLMRTRPNPQLYGRWFDFRVPVKELLRGVGWDLPDALVCRLGIAGDVEPGGQCSFSLKGLEVT